MTQFKMHKLTQSRLKELIRYSPKTGIFIWTKNRKNQINSMSRAGGIHKNKGYRYIRVDGVLYGEHILAWLYMNGVIPTKYIDHINHDRADNRIENLRTVSHQVNMKNQKRRIDNTSGVVGVYWNKESNKWKAQLNIGGKRKGLGRFKFLESAEVVVRVHSLLNGYHKNHGLIIS